MARKDQRAEGPDRAARAGTRRAAAREQAPCRHLLRRRRQPPARLKEVRRRRPQVPARHRRQAKGDRRRQDQIGTDERPPPQSRRLRHPHRIVLFLGLISERLAASLLCVNKFERSPLRELWHPYSTRACPKLVQSACATTLDHRNSRNVSFSLNP